MVNDAMLAIRKCMRSLVQFLLVPLFYFLAWHNIGLESGLGDATSLGYMTWRRFHKTTCLEQDLIRDEDTI